eukprot:1083909-Pelagomonas_calceolata.AAC.3
MEAEAVPVQDQLATAAQLTKVVGSILLAGDQLLGVEQLAVGARADLVNHSGLQVQEDGAGHVLASTSLGEEGVEGIIATTNGLVGGHLPVRLNSMLLLCGSVLMLLAVLSNVSFDREGKSKHSHAHRGTRNKVGLESATAPFSNEQERTADTHRQVDAREM